MRRLVTQGREVTCLLRSGACTRRIDDLSWERVAGDVLDRAAVRSGLQGCEAAIHLACPSAWEEIESPGIDSVVVEAARNVLEEAGKQRRVVFVSSMAAIGPTSHPTPLTEETVAPERRRPGMSYAYAKRQAETLCRQSTCDGYDIVIVNPAETYGPEDVRLVTAGNLIGLIRQPLTLVCRGGTSVVHVDDVAEGIVAAMDSGRSGERYILGGENLDHVSLAKLVLEIAGRRQPVLALPNGLFRWATRAAAALRIPLPYHRNVVPYATRYWFADNAKARRELNVRFRSARETLEPTVEWLKTAGYVQ